MAKEATKEEGIKRNIRFPHSLFYELTDAAEKNDRSFNAEVLARVKVDQIDELRKEIADLKLMMRQVLDRIPD